MLSLGTKAPKFSLPDVVTRSNVEMNSSTKAKAYLVAFICNHCPYVIHIRDCFSSLGNDLMAKGGAVFAISSNDAEN